MMAFVRAWRARRHVSRVLKWDDAVTVVARQRAIALRNAALVRDAREVPGTDCWSARAAALAFVLRELDRHAGVMR